MYGWGPNDTSNWNDPGGYRYDPARSPYLDKLAADAKKKGPRTYDRPSGPDMELVNPRGKVISSDSENPIILAVDVTGSMASWPAEIFDRLPLFYQTLSQYRQDTEICFAAIGDANSDQYPLQVNSFGKGVSLEDHIKALYPEGGGGGQVSESYELFGHYILENCKTPKATSPFLFIFGDEKFYNSVDPAQVKHYIGSNLQAPRESREVWDGLLQRFNLYFLQKPYGNRGEGSITADVREHWAKAIGQQRIVQLPSKERAVDIAMGIVAKHWGQYGDFEKNLGARQDDPKVKESVHASIRFIPDGDGTKSAVDTTKRSEKTRSLSEMFDDAKR